MTSFHLRPVTEADVRDFARWRYDPPYDVYNILPIKESETELAEEVAYFLDPAVCCHAVDDENGELVAFCTFGRDGQVPGGDYSKEALDVGLGMRPERTGQGDGRLLVRTVAAYACVTWQPPRLRVTISEFNRRARRVWRRNGFVRTQRFVATKWTKRPFIVYVKRCE